MSTNAVLHFEDARGTYSVFKHWDGYPSGIAQSLEEAKRFAQVFPRFEADEFAAAFVAAHKDRSGGGIRLIENEASAEYTYSVSFEDGDLWILILEDDGEQVTWEGSLEQMKHDFRD